MCDSSLKLKLCEKITFWKESTEMEYLFLAEELVQSGFTELAAVDFLYDAYRMAEEDDPEC